VSEWASGGGGGEVLLFTQWLTVALVSLVEHSKGAVVSVGVILVSHGHCWDVCTECE
jgi:hypothetical protein